MLCPRPPTGRDYELMSAPPEAAIFVERMHVCVKIHNDEELGLMFAPKTTAAMPTKSCSRQGQQRKSLWRHACNKNYGFEVCEVKFARINDDDACEVMFTPGSTTARLVKSCAHHQLLRRAL